MRRVLLIAGLLPAILLFAAPAQGATLRAGVGSADITPKTGYYLGGWTRADRVAKGQHTRLRSRALVLQSGSKKVALAQVDLFMIPGGMVKHIGDALRARGFSEQNILISASHTHSGPGGYGNFNTFNTAAPSITTVNDPSTFVGLFAPKPTDRQLYAFLLDQITTAIRRADDDLGPAAAAWGETRILGLTQNRSIEAHLHNHGIKVEKGQGSVAQDPGGYVHTIDPQVNVLRVDKIVRTRRGRKSKRKRRRVPIGAWSTFADHGTVTKSTFQYYNQDHHASASGVFEAHVRRVAKVPRGQQVVNVYGNSNEGDQSAGLTRSGPAASDYVGRVEAGAMLRAWKRAGRSLSRRPALDSRWTRVCWCGQQVEGGRVAEQAEVGLPFFTGSEEERGPLYDVTRQDFEGRRSAVAIGPHGYKLGVQGVPADVPKAVPLVAIRVGSRLITSIPGEGTKEVGERLRNAVASAVAGSPIKRVVVSGLANEFVLYFTTPEEHDRQHYEGGQTLFGRLSSVLIQEQQATLAGRLVRGEPAQPAFAIDPTNGVPPTGPAYSSGAASGSIASQPPSLIRRLGHATIAWQGGPEGLDRPVDRGFVNIQRRVGRHWRAVTSDLGLQILWTVDASGRYTAKWEIPLNAKVGRYRMIIQAKRYRLVSRTFRVRPYISLKVRSVSAGGGRVAVALDYPKATRDVDLTWRPRSARGGLVRFRVGSRTVRARNRRGTVFSVRAPGGAAVSIPPGAARDRHGNTSAAGARVRD